MEKKKKKRKSIFRILSMMLVCLFCALALTGCVGGGGSGGASSDGNQSGGSGSGGSDKDGPSNPLDEIEIPKIPTSDDFLMGAIGVYEIDGDKKVFYDTYAEDFMSFNELKTRQFTSLASIIQGTLTSVYGGGGFSTINLNFGKKSLSYNISSILSGVNYTSPNYATCFSHAMTGCTLITDMVDDGNGGYQYNYEYLHNTGNLAWLRSSLSVEDFATQLEEVYKTCYGIPGDIEVLGFTEKYKTAVQDYIINNIIGSALYTSSEASSAIANISSPTAEFVHNNKASFQNYKNYENVIPKLIDSAFKASINGINLYAWSVDSAGISLYPKLTKTQYIYYDNIDDIQDINPEEKGFDPNEIDPSQNFGSLEDVTFDKGERVDGVYLRQLKNIILIPKLSDAYKNEFNETNFKLDNLFIDLQTESGETILDITWSGFAGGNVIDETFVAFSDGSYEVEIGGEIIKGEKPEDSPVTDDGKLTLDNEYYSSDLNSISFSEDDLLNYEFVDATVSSDELSSGMSLDDIVNGSFTEGKEDEQGNVEKMTEAAHKFLNVYNRLMKVEINESDNTVTTTILLVGNLINMKFNYDGGDDIPKTYLMKFSIYKVGNSEDFDSLFKDDKYDMNP